MHDLEDRASDYAGQKVVFLGDGQRWVLKPRSLKQEPSDIRGCGFKLLWGTKRGNGEYDLTNKPHLIFNVDKKGISQDHTQPHVI